MFEGEEWRPAREPLDHYLVSNRGRVRRHDSEEPRKLTVNDKGFPVLTLYGKDSMTRYLRQVNKLVAEAFLDEPHFSDMTAVWHIDGQLHNCRAENLKWETRRAVLEWNEMHRSKKPKYRTGEVRNNREGVTYENAYACAMAEGKLESAIVFRIERQARNPYDENARYSYVF